MFRINGYESTDYYALLVIQEYLKNRLYENIRVQQGLSYAPPAELIQSRKDGVFQLSAVASTRYIDKVLRLMHDEVNKLRDVELTDADLSKTIKSLIRNRARGLESNRSIAEYYIDFLHEVDTQGVFIDQEARLEGITPQEVRNVIERYLVDSKLIYLMNKPTLTYNQFYLLLLLTTLSIIFVIWLLMKRTHLRILNSKIKK